MVVAEKCIAIDSDQRLTATQVSGRYTISVREPGVRLWLPAPRVTNPGAVVVVVNQTDGKAAIECKGRFENGLDELRLDPRRIAMLWPIKNGDRNQWFGAVLDGLNLKANEGARNSEAAGEQTVTEEKRAQRRRKTKNG